MASRQRAGAPQSSSGIPRWTPPALTGNYSVKIGGSVVDEFVGGHEGIDVLRELVQNEFDAGGSEIDIHFGHYGLSVSGNGRTIDTKGWTRLGVIIGTGRVIGGTEGEVVEAKENGIGSKNLGLRSLFLFGDQIHIGSGGRIVVFNLQKLGTEAGRDPSTKGTRGIRLFVPYRDVAFGDLPAFSLERERQIFDGMAETLLSTLVKLALPGRRPGIRRLRLRSDRTGRSLDWTQLVEAAPCHAPGVSAARRVGRLLDRDPARTDIIRRFEEIEYSRAVAIPPEHLEQRFPAYYRGRSGEIRVAVAFATKRGKPVTAQSGYFYYPLRAPAAPTGLAISLSAPFKLDADRSALTHTDWNQWLVEAGVALVGDLLTSDWAGRYGADAYRLLLPRGGGAPAGFADGVAAGLKSQPCWLSRDKGTPFVKASHIALPDEPDFSGLLSDSRYLSDALEADPALRALCLAAGATRFTLNSLVRLRCHDGKNGAALASKAEAGETDLYYEHYAALLPQPARQLKFAQALGRRSRHLSAKHRTDLEATRSTLAADGSLQPASALVAVDPALAASCPVPASGQLHEVLYPHRVISGLCTPFVLSSWLDEVAARAAAGTASDEEREAAARALLTAPRLSSKTLGAVRRSPLFRNHRGEWQAPATMAMLPTAQTALLAPVIGAPSSEMLAAGDLVRRLRIRRQLVSDDLVAMAAHVADHPSKAEGFEALLRRHMKLLTPSVVQRLRDVAFLAARSGRLRAPADLHLDTALNKACLGDDDAIVGGQAVALHRQLECRPQPRAETLLARLAELGAEGTGVARPDVLYPALAEAIRTERLAVSSLADRAILWIGGRYVTPSESLLAGRGTKLLEPAVPVYRGSAVVEEAFEALGVGRAPRDCHWTAYFRWLASRYGAGVVLDSAMRRDLRSIYGRRGLLGPPSELAMATRALLTRRGTLMSVEDVRAGRLVEDDYPALADALQGSGARLEIAAVDEETREFFGALGLQRLSSICGDPKITAGATAPRPNWFREQHGETLLALLARDDFIQAIAELAWAQARSSSSFRAAPRGTLARRLRAVTALSFVEDVTRSYRVGGQRVGVPAEVAIEGSSIAVVPMRTKMEHEHVLARALAELAGASRAADARMLAVAILPLLSCRSSEDMQAFLRRQGIALSAWTTVNVPLEDLDDEPRDERTKAIFRELVDNLTLAPPPVPEQPPIPPVPPVPPTPPAPRPPAPLPDLDKVVPIEQALNGQPVPPAIPSGGGGGRDWTWTPRTPEEMLRDQAVGTQGEALVYRLEIERLRALGHAEPETLVTWTSRSDAGADHDICSLGDDGGPLWIEVKSTTGSDGRFDWPQREFAKALREGERYELVRVYAAASATPTIKRFRNPAALLGKQRLRLDLGSLRASVEGR